LSAEGGFNIAIPKGEEEGKRAQVKPFLPDPDSYPYINVPPGEVKEVSVVGSNPLPALKRPSLGRRQGARSHCEVTEDAYCRRRSNSMRPVWCTICAPRVTGFVPGKAVLARFRRRRVPWKSMS